MVRSFADDQLLKTWFNQSFSNHRLTKERDLLQRQKTNVSIVSDNLQLAQAQLEGAEHMQKIVLQVRFIKQYIKPSLCANYLSVISNFFKETIPFY